MIILDRMALADCFSPEELVSEIFRQCPDLPLPIPINEIASATGIVKLIPICSQSIEGMLVSDPGKNNGVIYYNPDPRKPIGRQRFTIGHELGHFLLLNHGPSMTCAAEDIKNFSKNTLKPFEDEANKFSQLLLLPNHLIQNEIDDKEPTIELLCCTSEKFNMSFEATANKCSSYGGQPFALVYSKDGLVRYCWRDWRKFPFQLPLKKGDAIPHRDRILINKNQSITKQSLVNPSLWLNPEEELPKYLLEQTYTQENGYQVTMLVAVN